MLGIEISFDEYLREFKEFEKKDHAKWAEVNREYTMDYKRQKIEMSNKQQARDEERAKALQAKNREKKRKHEGRFDMPKTFLAKKENKVVEQEYDEDYWDEIL